MQKGLVLSSNYEYIDTSLNSTTGEIEVSFSYTPLYPLEYITVSAVLGKEKELLSFEF